MTRTLAFLAAVAWGALTNLALGNTVPSFVVAILGGGIVAVFAHLVRSARRVRVRA